MSTGLKTTGDKIGTWLGRMIDSQKVAFGTALISGFGLNLYQIFLPLEKETTGGYKNAWWWWAIVVILFLFLIMGAIFSFLNTDDINKLKESISKLENDFRDKEEELKKEMNSKSSIISDYESQITGLQEEYQELLDQILITLFKNCDFKETERISVYRYSNSISMFVLIGRHAKSSKYDGPNPHPTRKQYDHANSGIIGRSWAGDSGYLPDLPDPGTETNEYLSKSNITLDQFQAMRMKSRCYLAINITDRNQRNVAVIVFESLKRDGIKEQEIRNIFESHLASIKKLVEKANDLNANVKIATQQNY